jgi:hypothetical protein
LYDDTCKVFRDVIIKINIFVSDEGMINGPPIFAYLVFGPGRVYHERLSRPT